MSFLSTNPFSVNSFMLRQKAILFLKIFWSLNVSGSLLLYISIRIFCCLYVSIIIMLSYIFYILYVNQHLIGEIMAMSLNKLYQKFFIIFVGIVLSVILNDYVSQHTNITGILGTVISFSPTFFALLLLQAAAK